MKQFTEVKKHAKEIGHVTGVTGSICQIDGLPGLTIGEMVLFESGQAGSILTLADANATAIVFSRDPLQLGTSVLRCDTEVVVGVSDSLIGTTIGSLGKMYSQHTKASEGDVELSVFTDPPGIYNRAKITRQLATGIGIIDCLVPLGQGQRELLIGDRKTGKTNIILSAMQSQAAEGTICIYAGIGKRKSEVKLIEASLKERGILKQSIIVFSSSYASPGEIFITPYTAMMIAEYFNRKGRDVLLILDDLTTHARYYRELSLLSKSFPGRDSYPGDIFHVHAKLLERAGNFVWNGKEVAITALPIAETAGSDMTGYIQTNLMSMTDGHLFCDSDLFFRGRRPAINPFISVTRVGRQTQTVLGRDIASHVVKMLADYEKALQFVRFGADVSDELKNVLVIGEAIWEVFGQTSHDIFPIDLQFYLIAKAYSGTWDRSQKQEIINRYMKEESFRKEIAGMVSKSTTLLSFVAQVKGGTGRQ